MKRKRQRESFRTVYGAPPFMTRQKNKKKAASEEESEYPWNHADSGEEQEEILEGILPDDKE